LSNTATKRFHYHKSESYQKVTV